LDLVPHFVSGSGGLWKHRIHYDEYDLVTVNNK